MITNGLQQTTMSYNNDYKRFKKQLRKQRSYLFFSLQLTNENRRFFENIGLDGTKVNGFLRYLQLAFADEKHIHTAVHG